MIVRVACLIALLQVSSAQSVPARGSIGGSVVQVGSREPLEDIRVDLVPEQPSPSRLHSSPARTDAQGRFVFKDLAAGTYRLLFSANGFVRREYGQRVFQGRGALLRLAADETIQDLTVELTPTGGVSGTVVDNDKQPLEGVTVQLMRVAYTSSGKHLLPVGTPAKSDDRGEYRISFVTPGRYYVNAGTPLKSGRNDLLPAFNSVSEDYATVFFPGVSDMRFATPLDVPPGSTLNGVDFRLGRLQGVRVRGRIIDAMTGRPPENNPSIMLSLRDPIGEDYSLDSAGRRLTYNKGDGTFEFRDVPSGFYGLVASALLPGQPRLATRLAPERTGVMSLEVGSGDVEGLVIVLSPGASLPGRVRVEGRTDIDVTTVFSSGTKSIVLEPWFNGGPSGPSPIPGGALLSWAEIKPDGVFRIENVMPGEYSVGVGPLRPGMYVKEARLGLTDILSQPFRFSGRETGNLEVVLSPNVASLEGIVTDNRSSTAPGAQVVLIPKGSGHRTDLFKTAVTDQDGRFALTNVAPGDYTLYAWEAIEPNRWFDSDFVKADEQYAQPVRLTESSRQDVTLKVIPARNP